MATIKIDAKAKLTEHFTMEEMLVGNKSDITLTPVEWARVRTHYNMLEEFRKWYGKPIGINSGIRSKALNKEVGGVANSNHLKGTATDLNIKCNDKEFVKLAKKWKAICKKHKVVGEAGHYEGFIHLGSYITYSKSFYNWKTASGKQKNMFYKI